MIGVGLSVPQIAGFSSAFSPAELFAAGEQGVWYDPSDLSTMFQDAAGTTPVTAVEQPVGKILDKSGRGNHATQASEASRPLLSARVNQLTFSEQFDNAAWGLSAVTIAIPTRYGSDEVSFPAVTAAGDVSVVRQQFTSLAAEYLGSVEVKAKAAGDVGKTICIYFNDGSAVNLIYHTLTADWVRISVTETTAAITTCYFNIGVLGSTYGGGNQGACSINIRKADARLTNDGVGLPAYQRIAAATDYDATGFPLHLKFDGNDDSLATGSIDFSATDKMSVFAGIRKLSDAATQVYAELTGTWPGAPGSFALYQDPSGSSYYASAARGNAAPNANQVATTTSATYAAPRTDVLSSLHDIAGDSSTLRISGVAATSATGDKGTGNFANSGFYIGRRANAALPFYGRLYSLIIRGAQSSAAQIASAEAYVNSKTRAYP